MKTIFIKSVRNNGSSLFARGKYERKYEIGKRYTFEPNRPAFVGLPLLDYKNLRNAWFGRPEPVHATRVLLCYGEVTQKHIRVLRVWCADDWNDSSIAQGHLATHNTCDDFEVIGEIFYPRPEPITP